MSTIFETLKEVNYMLQNKSEVEKLYAQALLNKCIILLEKGFKLNDDFDDNR